jgi:hypothetical protein
VRPGHRNGHAELTVRTTAGPLRWNAPSCAAHQSRSPRGCSARVWLDPTRWSRWSSPGSSAACRSVMSRRPWPMRSVPRRHCRNRPLPGSARRSRASSPPGGSGGWTTSSLTTRTWTAPTSRCTRRPR